MKNNKCVKNLLYSIFAMIILCVCFGFSSVNVKAAENDVVYIPDANFKELLNKKLGVADTTADITETQLATIRYLQIVVNGDKPITDITGISYCTGLSELSLRVDSFEQATVDKAFTDELAKLSNITNFTMSEIDCSDYSFMQNYSKMVTLSITYCDIAGLPDLSKCTGLTYLSVAGCEKLVDISSIASLRNIERIDLGDCKSLRDISALTGMTKLTSLDLEKVAITEEYKDKYMNAIATLINLDTIYMYYCGITDEHTSMFDNLTKLKYLGLGMNDISNIDFLLKHKEILEHASLNGFDLDNEDVRVIEQLTNLVILDVREGSISDFSFIQKLPKLIPNDMRWAWNWEPTRSSVNIYIPCFTKPSSVTIVNDVKDAYGNYVAPVESENYKYNSETNEIIVYTGNITSSSVSVTYDFTNENTAGCKFNINHTKRIQFIELEEGLDQDAFLDDEATLTIRNIWYNELLEYQWYKDGQKIEGATSSSLNIKNITLDDAGKYTAVVKCGDYTVVSDEIILTVNNYKKLSATLEISIDSADDLLYADDYVRYKVTVEGGTGQYEYSFWKREKGKSSSSGVSNKLSNEYLMRLFAGEIELYARVSDSDNNYTETNVITVNVNEKIKGNFTIDGSAEKNNILVGDSIELNIESTGGVGDHTYKYEVENLDTGEIETIKDYSSDDSMIVKITHASKLQYTVYVKDSCGREVASNMVRVSAYDKFLSAEFTINGVKNNAEGILGENVTLEIIAQGGSGQYRYDYIIYDAVIKEIVRYRTYFTDKSVLTWKPKTNGTYLIAMAAKDNDGNYVYPEGIESFGAVSENMLKLKVVRKPGLYEAPDGEWYYYVKDEIDVTYTGMAQNETGWWYVKNGKIDETYTGIVQKGQEKWYVKLGKFAETYTGMVQNGKEWLYATAGKIDESYTGMVKKGQELWYVSAGKQDKTYVGLVNYNSIWVYVSGGKNDTTYTGLVKYKSSWVYVSEGKLDATYTGLVKYKSSWVYVSKGKLYATYTGMVKNGSDWWYVSKGKLDTTYTGLVKYKTNWVYVIEGKLNTTYTGLVKYNSTWVYVCKGKLDATYTGMAKNPYGWWYVTKGKLDLTFTGIADNAYGIWYLQNGKLDLTFSGKVTVDGKIYTIKKGKVIK